VEGTQGNRGELGEVGEKTELEGRSSNRICNICSRRILGPRSSCSTDLGDSVLNRLNRFQRWFQHDMGLWLSDFAARTLHHPTTSIRFFVLVVRVVFWPRIWPRFWPRFLGCLRAGFLGLRRPSPCLFGAPNSWCMARLTEQVFAPRTRRLVNSGRR
jgi:hypothetical protein